MGLLLLLGHTLSTTSFTPPMAPFRFLSQNSLPYQTDVKIGAL